MFMSASYSVTAKIGVKDRRRASGTIRRYIREHDGVNCDFALNDFRAEGVSTRSFDGLMRIIFAGWKGTEFVIRRNRTSWFTRTPSVLPTDGKR